MRLLQSLLPTFQSGRIGIPLIILPLAGPPIEAQSLQQTQVLSHAMDQERAQQLGWEDIPLVERLSTSLGYKLVNEACGAPLAQRIRGVRPLLARYAWVFRPGLHVLSQNEIPERVGVQILVTLG